ncbi:MAG: helix-turn-helix transcriptional regulator [Alistipes sp.]
MPVEYTEEILRISHRIRELRKKRKLTIQELAYRCDIERSNMSRIEAGRTNITLKTLCVICKALEISLIDLFG